MTSDLWTHVEILRLHQNMQLSSSNANAQQFAQWLLDVGHGKNMITGNKVCFPEQMCVPNVDSLIDSIYPGIDSTPLPPPDYFLDRIILTPHNADISDLNEKILGQMSGEAQWSDFQC